MFFAAAPTQSLLVRVAWQVPLAIGLAALAVLAAGVRPELVLFLYLAAVTGEMCRADLSEHRLPNTLVVPGYGFAAVGLLWRSVASGTPPWLPLASGAALFGFLLVLNLADGMGMGDVKLGGVLGIALGTLGIVPSFAGPVLGFVAGGVAGVAALLLPSAGTLRRIPFGPFLLFGFWAGVALDPAAL
ncbi:MAG: leader peptidase (prepilin peptidase) / N-methyltransferase [Microbacteriaceae bacterium]|jgi:leader peptidase (prepilin peptidase)/N-methyltransferase|nr:leader peptidase (prepilin peptidase) / N-methyltransferase [Microbacteriaceae bacterium]